jgi:hypothetical protein
LFLLLDDRFAAPGGALVLGGMLLLIAIGVLIAVFLNGMQREPLAAVPVPSADSSHVAVPRHSEGQAGEVAGSRRLSVDFDSLATNSEIEGWDLTDGARFTTAVQPTAVDRSARLQNGTACHALDVDVAELDATFMVDGTPPGEASTIAVEVGDGTVVRVTISNGQATVADGAEPVVLESGRWYGWRLAFSGDEVLAEILAPDGSVLSADRAVVALGARASRVCLTAGSSSSLYLSDLAVGTR